MTHTQLRTPEQRLADYEAAYQNALDSEHGLTAEQCAEFERRIETMRQRCAVAERFATLD